MRPASPRTRLIVSSLFLAVASAGCAKRIPDATPADIPLIRQQLAESPGDPALQTRLGIALYRSDDFAGAEEVLARLVEEGEPSGAAYLYLGLANEEQEDWAGARQAYQAYLALGADEGVRDDIRGRLALIARNELRQEARQALAREAELATVEPAPRSVAVFPFRLLSDNEDLDPLRLALADMMITDLGLVGGLTVLERSQIQALLDEMALNEAGLTEEATGARAGRLLGSEHVVQGVLTTTGENQLQFDADVLNTESRSSRGRVSDETELEALFEAEKRVVFGILDALQVQLTAAEREAITENRAENLLAFLEYGRGLGAMDRGDYEQATEHFRSAVGMDPGFGRAQMQQQEAADLQTAATTSTDQVASAAGAGSGPGPDVGTTLSGVEAATTGTNANGVVGAATPGTGTTTTPTSTGGSGPPQERNPVPESTGQDKTGGTVTTKLTVTIPRPGSGGEEEL